MGRYYNISSSKFILQRGHWSAFPAENRRMYRNIALHFGHRIPMYMSMFPTRNTESAPYNNVLNNPVGVYFSVYANRINAENPTATKVKYNFFRLFILSLGLTLFIFLQPCLLYTSPSPRD